MITYFNKLDKKVNETLTLYSEIGKMTKPMFNHILLLISIIIFTSCFSIIYCLNNSDFSIENNFIHIALPIMIYGLISPILSTIISYVFKEYIEQQIKLLKNNKKNFIINNMKYDKRIFLNKENFIIFLFLFIIYLSDVINFYFNISLNLSIFLFNTFYKINNINNKILCDIKSVEKCYDNCDEFYRYNIEINCGDQKRIIQKRFSDFKELNNNLNNDKKLPTSSWFISPLNLNDAQKRGNKLNKYIKNVLKDNNNLSNTIINNFISNDINNDINNNIITIEKKNYNNSSNLDELKINISKLLGLNIENIKSIFILNEINIYLNNKKRIFIVIDNFLYKIKYNKSYNNFEVRLKIDIFDIKKLIVGRITNTTYFINKDILEIQYKNTYIILTSFDNDKIYNISSLYQFLLKNIKQEIDILHNYDYKLFTGLGLSEILFNNHNFLKLKKIFLK
tara:strand:+ start:766 stop:2121 length:1356 start_codon:yes stop_codon:yes gene_type:complete